MPVMVPLKDTHSPMASTIFPGYSPSRFMICVCTQVKDSSGVGRGSYAGSFMYVGMWFSCLLKTTFTPWAACSSNTVFL